MTGSSEQDKRPSEERQQTDESLRVEREKVDHALEVAHVDETADAVIGVARVRADALLAAARAKQDRNSKARSPITESHQIVERERAVADRALREERAHADEILREEREEHVAHLALERMETDNDLSDERARSDNALATRDEFLGIVSHDLRNMLSSVVGFAGLLVNGLSLANREDEALLLHAHRIQRSGARMNRLIGDLVDVASIEAGMLAVTREVGDPTHVVAEAVDTFQAQATANAVSLTVEIVPPPSLAAFDPARILQVLTNLLSNAIKFTPRNGKVAVRVERVGDEIRFAVSDTGTGIPTEKLEAIFERFLQVTKNDRRGLGLGLFISKCIVQGHGGRIWAESRSGGGTTVAFTLPIHLAS